ncbi:ATP-binding cassette domain-containing protein [Paenibacillus sp. FJAT-26967]|uniref:ABC transporter ATP-binding protein n=1 Tax=Paenibacillus sp. FJAT-26967 TaxID=1729690 RepID=UPI000838B640|nr:ATP-binding cassette domain-containing protein [Paenibacillus sp. FJAT-26967]
MSIIRVEDLCKVYQVKKLRTGALGGIVDLFAPQMQKKEAVKSIGFSIDRGEAVGYIGPNGSGKSTTIKLMTGILTPTSGKVTVNGIEPYKKRKENAQRIGAVFGQKSQLVWDLSPKDSFELFRFIYRIPEPVYKRNLDKMMTLLRISEFDTTPVRQLSLGQRMRAEIACAFFHNPDICYLDEPTIGLDIVAKEHIREFLREINQEKETTIILTTHDMDDIEQVCGRIILINEGQIIHDGAMKQFREIYGKERVLTVQLEEDVTAMSIEGTRSIELKDRVAKIHYDKHNISSTRLIQMIASQYQVLDCHIEEPRIEVLIRDFYEKRVDQTC